MMARMSQDLRKRMDAQIEKIQKKKISKELGKTEKQSDEQYKTRNEKHARNN